MINQDLTVNLPPEVIIEYDITSEGKIYLMSGSKATGGFIITRKGLLYHSKIGNILRENKSLCDYELPKGVFIKYKGRYYCWTDITNEGKFSLDIEMMKMFDLEIGTKLLCIRSSNIAFTMGLKGTLMERARNYDGIIDIF